MEKTKEIKLHFDPLGFDLLLWWGICCHTNVAETTWVGAYAGPQGYLPGGVGWVGALATGSPPGCGQVGGWVGGWAWVRS